MQDHTLGLRNTGQLITNAQGVISLARYWDLDIDNGVLTWTRMSTCV
jgi:hypothetical protein